MMSQDNRLLPVPTSDHNIDRPLRDLMHPVQVSTPSSEPTHLRDYLAVVLKRRWLILTLVTIITTLVAVQSFLSPNIYQGETEIRIEQKSKSPLQTGNLVINATNPAAEQTYWNTQLKLLESPLLARQVIQDLDLQNNSEFLQNKGGLLERVRRVLSPKKAEAPKPKAIAVDTNPETDVEHLTPEQLAALEPYEWAIRNSLTIEPVEKTSLVKIRYTHTNPELAMKVTNGIAERFIINDVRRETAGSERAADLLARQIVDLQLKIKQGNEVRLNYLKNHNLPLGDAKEQNLTLVRLDTLSQQLLKAENERKSLQAIYEAAKSEKDVYTIPAVQESRIVDRLRSRLEDLDNRRAALLVQYTPEWPEVKKLDEQIKQTKQELDKSIKDVIEGLRTNYENAVTHENKIREAFFQERDLANQQSLDEVEISNVVQDLETHKQLYKLLFQRQKELEIVSSDRSNNVTISNPSRIPREPVGPKRFRNIFIALFLSFSAGVGLAFLLDYLDDTLKSIDDVDRYLHVPTLALIPAPRTERSLLKGKVAVGTPAFSGPGAGRGDSTALALIDDSRSPVAEAYRHLRTSLLLSSAGQPPRTILVTSSQPSEGKTTTAVNTAVMFAQTGAEVLIIDCDLRRPRLHAHFNLPNHTGISNYLSSTETNVDNLIQPYPKMPNLKVITSGPVPPSPAELLGGDGMRRLLSSINGRFAHIIIDSPPAISFTDASILSTMVDGVMLVVHGGRSSRAVVRRAKQLLVDVGANIYGIVLNNVKLDSQDYNYYTTYYAAGYYEADDDNSSSDQVSKGTSSGR
jgi:polysaccharide biosynthesis transport protein